MTAPVSAVRRWIGRTVVLAALLLGARGAEAQINVSGNPPTLRIQSATIPGGQLAPATDNTTTYTIFVFSWGRGNQKNIVAQLNAPMPAGTTLSVMLEAPQTGTSTGLVPLSTTAQNVITGMTIAIATKAITYQFQATPAAGVIPPQSRTVTFTVVSGA
ncbi:MAG TPA: hypothetical protein VFK16_08060 [Gemmatimonadaceae bacterium]|jgi:hypothetical protein|nr:hypothetical protein [Gemmatimonadaceae bacterium]